MENIMKLTIKLILTCSFLSLLFSSCQTFLDEIPRGQLSESQVATADKADKMVIAAYSCLGNDNTPESQHMWPYGDLRAGDAYKGGGGTQDQVSFHYYETFNLLRTDDGWVNAKWFREYVAISRTNSALNILNNLSESDFPQKTIRIAEMRFLRAHFYFELKILFKNMPYIDENVPVDEYTKTSNKVLSDIQLWDKIISDLTFATQNLPVNNNGDLGRANKWMAESYLAKAYLYSAYEQNEKNEVININTLKLDSVVKYTNDVITKSGKSLSSDFANNFRWETENGVESIFAVQYSYNDGTLYNRGDWGTKLNYPMGSTYGCCAFHAPSQNLINSYRTIGGLPDFVNFNSTNLMTPGDLKSNTIDPRLLHSVAFVGLPYKYNPTLIFAEDWLRDPANYGRNFSLKEVVLPDCPCLKKQGPFFISAKNRDIIRFDDVLLWKAEALIQLGTSSQLEEARTIINSIRNRAKTSTDLLKNADKTFTGNFNIQEYPNSLWTKDYAFKALQWERRLEFALEGFRFFDLTRWGIADETLNTYFNIEKTRRPYLNEAAFTKNKDEYFPIPKVQIDLSKNLYKQNYGW